MNTTRALFVTALFALIAQGCATSDTGRFDTTHVADLRQRTVDRARVASWFGEPVEVEHASAAAPMGACVEAWHWSNATRDTWQNLTVYFDAQGNVCDHAFSGAPRARTSIDARLGRLGARRFAVRAR